MKICKKYIAVLALVIVALAVGIGFFNKPQKTLTWKDVLGKPEYTNVTINKPLRAQTRIVEISGRRFEIPLMYITGQLDKGERQKDGMVLVYVLPNFTSKLEFKTKAEYQQAFNEQRFAHMLIEPAAERPSLDLMIKRRRNGLTKEDPIEMEDGLHAYKWYYGTLEKLRPWSETYLDKDKDGNITNFIECSTFDQGMHIRFPTCSHKFIDKNLLYSISYNKKNYFATWREQKAAAIRFIDGLEIAQTKLPEEKGE